VPVTDPEQLRLHCEDLTRICFWTLVYSRVLLQLVRLAGWLWK
jgi:hypothetical protein